MVSTSHECPYPGCGRVVPRHMFACRSHWYLLPHGLRDEIWQGYRGDIVAHVAAMAAAIEWYRDHADGQAALDRAARDRRP